MSGGFMIKRIIFDIDGLQFTVYDKIDTSILPQKR